MQIWQEHSGFQNDAMYKGKSTKNNGGFHDNGNKLRISLKSAKLNKRLVEICHTVTSNILLQTGQIGVYY